MQLVNTERVHLIAPLQVANGIIESRHVKPILANVLIRKTAGQIEFIASDEDIQVKTNVTLGEMDMGEDLATTVPAKKLFDIIKALPEAPIKLELQNKKMLIQSLRSKFLLQTLPAESFPLMGGVGEPICEFTTSQRALKELIQMVQYSMAIKDIRSFLQGMLFAVREQKLVGVTSDGHRLALDTINIPDLTGHDINVIVPRKTVLELQRQLQECEDPIAIAIYTSHIEFRFGLTQIISRLVDGKFPDFDRLIPKDHPNILVVNRAILQQSMQRAAILTSDKSKAIRLDLNTDVLHLSVANIELEEADEEVEVKYQGPSMNIGFNVEYLLDAVNYIKSDEFTIFFGDSTSSVLFSVADKPQFKYVVMPMKI